MRPANFKSDLEGEWEVEKEKDSSYVSVGEREASRSHQHGTA
jgi:hypothetical protein